MAEDDNTKPAGPKPLPKPEYGADSQLRCYNAATWRLAELFDADDDEPQPAPSKPKK